jgi:hypothetical protein
MVKVRKTHPGDVMRLSVRPEQGGLSLSMMQAQKASVLSLTFLHEGRPVLVAGLSEVYAERAIAWALVGEDVPLSAWRAIIREGRSRLIEASLRYIRIEAYAAADWPQARRSLAVLGFEEEAVLKDFTPKGDCVIARYNG